MVRKVCIMGAGVGGLTTAIELSKNADFEVTIIERNYEIGGQARSRTIYDKNGKILNHSEYCWHAIHCGYNNFLTVMTKTNSNIFNYLKPISKYIYSSPRGQYIEYNNAFLTVDRKIFYGLYKLYNSAYLVIQNMWSLMWLYMTILFACKERTESWDKIKWSDYLSYYKFSAEINRWLLDSTSIFLGMDYRKLSTHTMANLIRLKSVPYPDPTDSLHKYMFYSLTQPMSNILFDNIESYLLRNNVNIYKGIHIKSLEITETKITGITLDNKEILNDFDEHTIYVNGLSVESFAGLICRPSITKLAELGHQIQTQVFYTFRQEKKYSNGEGLVIIHYDTPWFLMSRAEETFWESKFVDYDCYWSVGIGLWDIKGLNGKTASDCTPKEIAEECWRQMQMDIKLELPELNDINVKWNIWDSYKWDNQIGQLTSYEPKWSNSINTLELRPKIKDDIIENLYNTTAYSLNKTIMFNMEGAAESGVRAANLIQSTVDKINDDRETAPIWIRIIRLVDSFFFAQLKC